MSPFQYVKRGKRCTTRNRCGRGHLRVGGVREEAAVPLPQVHGYRENDGTRTASTPVIAQESPVDVLPSAARSEQVNPCGWPVVRNWQTGRTARLPRFRPQVKQDADACASPVSTRGLLIGSVVLGPVARRQVLVRRRVYGQHRKGRPGCGGKRHLARDPGRGKGRDQERSEYAVEHNYDCLVFRTETVSTTPGDTS